MKYLAFVYSVIVTASLRYDKIITIDCCMGVLFPYWCMILCFWKWNIHQMIRDKKRWNEIVFYGNMGRKNPFYHSFALKI